MPEVGGQRRRRGDHSPVPANDNDDDDDADDADNGNNNASVSLCYNLQASPWSDA